MIDWWGWWMVYVYWIYIYIYIEYIVLYRSILILMLSVSGGTCYFTVLCNFSFNWFDPMCRHFAPCESGAFACAFAFLSADQTFFAQERKGRVLLCSHCSLSLSLFRTPLVLTPPSSSLVISHNCDICCFREWGNGDGALSFLLLLSTCQRKLRLTTSPSPPRYWNLYFTYTEVVKRPLLAERSFMTVRVLVWPPLWE